ncbi:MAG: hypothetical protein JSV04_05980 [Candidatus Heimdallarchaeota archaeon]|nr:MAG: hypothetical protein JSV04_05980 [Candidatus Heimdallarchaeota archaeon]
MTVKSKKPLIVPITMTVFISSIALLVFFTAQQIQVELPPHPEIHPNLSRNGSSYSGFIDVVLPFNISNRSPVSLNNVKIYASMSVISVENFGLFPDTTIANISEEIQTITPHSFTQIELRINISSWIPILAVVNAYLVLDIDISLNYQIGPLVIPFHLVGRLQDSWIAPFSF